MKLTLTAFANSLPIVFLSREGIRTFCHEQVKSIFFFFFFFFNALVLADWSISTSWLLHLGTFQHLLCSTLRHFNFLVAPAWNVSTTPSRGVFQLPHCSVLERFNFPIAPSCVCVCVCVCVFVGGGGGDKGCVRACVFAPVCTAKYLDMTPSRTKRQVPFIL